MNSKIVKYGFPAFIIAYGVYYGYNHLFVKRFYTQAYEIQNLKSKIQKKFLKATKSIITHLSIVKQITIPTSDFSQKFLKLQPVVSALGPKSNLQLQCILVSNLAKKEQKNSFSHKQTVNPFLPPFLDGIFITELSETHRLIFNRFAIADLHVLVITKNFEKQLSLINQQDIDGVLKVMQALDGFCYYNSGNQSGASQQHKHFQILPFNEIKKSQIIKQITKQATKIKNKKEQIFQYKEFNFMHSIMAFTLKEPLEKQILNAYQQCFIDCFNELETKFQTSYNLIITQEWLMLVPRKRSHMLQNTNNPVSVNAMAFTGSIAVKNEQQFENLQQVHLEYLFNEITFSNKDDLQKYIEGIKMFHSQ